MTDPENTVLVRVRDVMLRPGGRYSRLGLNSGEEFRDKYLLPPLLNGQRVRVELDGVRGYGSSFLDEAFGGIVRKLHLTPDEVAQRVTVETSVPSWKLDVEEYIRDALKTK